MVIGIIKGKFPGKTILLRADMDALRVNKETTLDYKSKIDGIMHACGHDGHIASLLGVAMILNELKDEINGNIKLMFQPDEEIHGGVPYSSIDPIPILAQVINTIKTIVSRKNNPVNPLVISCCHVLSGNIHCHYAIPTEARIGGTVRTFDENTIKDVVEGITKCQGATYEYEYIRQFPPLINDKHMTDLALSPISKIVEKGSLIYKGSGLIG